jgi:hypothetical protein
VVECLLNKFQALSSNPNTTKNKTNKQKNYIEISSHPFRKAFVMERNHKTGEVAKLVQCLPDKHEALSLNSTSKKKKKERKKERKKGKKKTSNDKYYQEFWGKLTLIHYWWK